MKQQKYENQCEGISVTRLVLVKVYDFFSCTETA